ncbi:unnamed protein product [Pleuronectes platessa]|uniref:Uncharacterized protein n=1 Tax=Pleuronectes platessa TaxID=8262 RepID=A0A9N7Z5E1_PLEPL|nr:unnamed protein product [Pleuronectes platessa]
MRKWVSHPHSYSRAQAAVGEEETGGKVGLVPIPLFGHWITLGTFPYTPGSGLDLTRCCSLKAAFVHCCLYQHITFFGKPGP